jgi:hypothetical protein
VDDDLERRQQAVLRRVLAKTEAVKELRAGRLTLVQAAARFRDADAAGPPGCEPGPLPADEEGLCRAVIAWVRGSYVVDRFPEAPAMVARLEAELERLRGPDGIVRLPD